MVAESPHLLGCAPSAGAAAALTARAPPRPVSTIEFAWEQGLLITGHEGGEVRVKKGAQPSRPHAAACRMIAHPHLMRFQ